MGAYMAGMFERQGYQIKINDPKAIVNTTIDECVQSDVLMFSTPIRETPKLIREYGHLIKPTTLVTDVTSRKKDVIKAMLETLDDKVEIVLMHPMFRPTIPPKGQSFIMVPIKPGDSYKELERVITAEGGIIKKIENAEKHDSIMDMVQGLPHTMHIVGAMTEMDLCNKYNITFNELRNFSTAFYGLSNALNGRIINGNPELYGPIQMDSENMLNVLRANKESLEKFIKIIENKDMDSFKKMFNELKEFMGNCTKQDTALTDKLIKYMSEKN